MVVASPKIQMSVYKRPNNALSAFNGIVLNLNGICSRIVVTWPWSYKVGLKNRAPLYSMLTRGLGGRANTGHILKDIHDSNVIIENFITAVCEVKIPIKEKSRRFSRRRFTIRMNSFSHCSWASTVLQEYSVNLGLVRIKYKNSYWTYVHNGSQK